MNIWFYTYLAIEFLIFFLIFFRMARTNEEEWKYTRYVHGLLIGAIIGLLIGATSGYALFNITGLWLGASYGIVIGAISFALNILIFNITIKKREKRNRKDMNKILSTTKKNRR